MLPDIYSLNMVNLYNEIGSRQTWVYIQALLLRSCLALGKTLNLSEPVFYSTKWKWKSCNEDRGVESLIHSRHLIIGGYSNDYYWFYSYLCYFPQN